MTLGLIDRHSQLLRCFIKDYAKAGKAKTRSSGQNTVLGCSQRLASLLRRSARLLLRYRGGSHGQGDQTNLLWSKNVTLLTQNPNFRCLAFLNIFVVVGNSSGWRLSSDFTLTIKDRRTGDGRGHQSRLLFMSSR